MLYILLVIAAPFIRGTDIATANITVETIIPRFDFTYFTTLSMLVFAVGGAEKISPYVNNTKNPSDFVSSYIILFISFLTFLNLFLFSLFFQPVMCYNRKKRTPMYAEWRKL